MRNTLNLLRIGLIGLLIEGVLCASTRDGLVVLSPQVRSSQNARVITGTDFEGALPKAFASRPAVEIVSGTGPQGQKWGSIAGPEALARVRLFPEPGQPQKFSIWLRTPGDLDLSLHFPAENATLQPVHYPLTISRNAWRHLTLYFRQPTQARYVDVQLLATESLALDTATLADATWDELAEAYAREFEVYPVHDTIPTKDAGEHLRLAAAKWRGEGAPGKSFVVWALGDNWPVYAGNGMPLALAIARNYPQAPPVVYHTSPPPDSEPPDLILTVAGEDTGVMLSALRMKTTANVMVASSVPNHKLAELCAEHRAQYIPHYQEFADYLKRHELTETEVAADLNHMRLRFWDAFCRRISPNIGPVQDKRERLVPLSDIHSIDGGRRLHLPVHGNRVDLIGRKLPNGGTAYVYLDGKPASEFPLYNAQERIDLSGDGRLHATLFWTGLARPHKLDVVIKGDHAIEGLYIYKP